jgi:hypothetical protein
MRYSSKREQVGREAAGDFARTVKSGATAPRVWGKVFNMDRMEPKMKGKVAILTVLFVLGSIACICLPAEAVVVTSVTEITRERIIQSPDVQKVDEIVDKLLSALNENNYTKFANYYNPKMKGTLSGSVRKKLSQEAFAELYAEMTEQGGRYISKRMVAGDGSGRMVRNDYIATFTNEDYASRIGVIATNDTGNQCIVDFWICWFDAREVSVANDITDHIVAAIVQDNYASFSGELSEALKSRFPEEEFQVLKNAFRSELGSYREKKNTFYNKQGNVLSVSSALYFEKTNKPIQVTVDVELLNGAARVKNLSFQWVPLTMLRQADILAERSLSALVNENNYLKFISCLDSQVQAAFTEEQFQMLHDTFADKYGKYLHKELLGVNLLSRADSEATQLPVEIKVFQYAVSFQSTKELNLSMTLARDNGQLVIRNFNIDEPVKLKYMGHIGDKN